MSIESNKFSIINQKSGKELKPEIMLSQGKSEMFVNDKMEFSYGTMIGGHDATHALMASFFEKIGITSRQGSCLNEALVVGTSLSMIPEFERDFRSGEMTQMDHEINRIKYLFESFVFSKDTKLSATDMETLITIFKLSRTLGLLSKNIDTQFTKNLNELYTLHKAWYKDKTDNENFEVSSEVLIDKNAVQNSAIKMMVQKIQDQILLLPESLK